MGRWLASSGTVKVSRAGNPSVKIKTKFGWQPRSTGSGVTAPPGTITPSVPPSVEVLRDVVNAYGGKRVPALLPAVVCAAVRDMKY